jgi:uncharacterized protein (TIGR03435 family)
VFRGITFLLIMAAQDSTRPQFDVASVKPCDPHGFVGKFGGTSARGQVNFNCQTLMNYVRTAYGRWGNPTGGPKTDPINIVGGPTWIDKDRFAITAKSDSAPSVAATNGPMRQALLEERFKLKIHKETREVPVYALVSAKARLKLPAAKAACITLDPDHPFPRPKEGDPHPEGCGRGRMTKEGIEVHGSTMAEFCQALTHTPFNFPDRRKFVDQTGIAGRFDFDLKFPDDDPDTVPDDFLRLQWALQKVGLQITSAKATDEFIVIDHAERPTAN